MSEIFLITDSDGFSLEVSSNRPINVWWRLFESVELTEGQKALLNGCTECLLSQAGLCSLIKSYFDGQAESIPNPCSCPSQELAGELLEKFKVPAKKLGIRGRISRETNLS